MKKRYFQKVIGALVVVQLLVACKKDSDSEPADVLHTEAEIKAYSIIGQEADVEIDATKRSVDVTFNANVVSAADMVAEFTLSEGAKASVGTVAQVSGQTIKNLETPVIYTITSEDGKNIREWNVTATNNATTKTWGLGNFQKATQSNEANYSWYFDQGNSGTYSSINCGPASTTMAAKWSDPSFTKTPLDARAAYRAGGGWWYTSDVVSYLNDNSIPNWYINLDGNKAGTQQKLKTELDNGNVVLLCLDAYYISDGPRDERRINKFYTTNAPQWGHFIVVKGYKQVDNQFYFEVYDPFSFGAAYNDGSIKGKDRYYKSEDIFVATYAWWNYAIVVSQKEANGGRLANKNGLNPSEVPQQRGR